VANRIKELDGSAITADSGKPLESVRASNTAGSATAGSGSGSGTSTGAAPDSVYITQSARTLASLSQTVQDTPDVDSARVTTLQQSIGAGLYKVDPDRVAGLMLQLEQELSGTMSQ
jgi:flagellar biosynthesis anti-sigma factor FlgM